MFQTRAFQNFASKACSGEAAAAATQGIRRGSFSRKKGKGDPLLCTCKRGTAAAVAAPPGYNATFSLLVLQRNGRFPSLRTPSARAHLPDRPPAHRVSRHREENGLAKGTIAGLNAKLNERGTSPPYRRVSEKFCWRLVLDSGSAAFFRDRKETLVSKLPFRRPRNRSSRISFSFRRPRNRKIYIRSRALMQTRQKQLSSSPHDGIGFVKRSTKDCCIIDCCNYEISPS